MLFDFQAFIVLYTLPSWGFVHLREPLKIVLGHLHTYSRSAILAALRVKEQAGSVDEKFGVKRKLRNLYEDAERKMPMVRTCTLSTIVLTSLDVGAVVLFPP